MTLYESYKEQIKSFAKRKQNLQSKEDKMVFKWKIVVILFGVVLILTIGGLSEIIKAISANQINDYDTSFIYSLLEQTKLLDTTEEMKYFIVGLNSSSQIKYDKSELLYRGQIPDLSDFLGNISDHENLLYFWDVSILLSNGTQNSKFGFFFQKKFYFDTEADSINVIESRDHKLSSIFSLSEFEGKRLNQTDDCSLYKYTKKDNKIKMGQLIHIDGNSLNETLTMQIGNWKCFGSSQGNAQRQVQRLIGRSVSVDEKLQLGINEFEVYRLSFENEKIVL